MTVVGKLKRTAGKTAFPLLVAVLVPLAALFAWPKQAEGQVHDLGNRNLTRYTQVRAGRLAAPQSGAAARAFKLQRRLSDLRASGTVSNPGNP